MKIKKILLLILSGFALSGCVNVKDLSINDILNNFNNAPKEVNTLRNGYAFYSPKGIYVISAGSNHAILASESQKYYLYIDLISYDAKSPFTFTKDTSAYFSDSFKYDNKDGYLQIKLQENNQYLVEIMYNYAKIEVMVDNELLNNALINAISILQSIKYNDNAIKSLLSEDNLDYSEERFDIFESKVENSDILDYFEESRDDNNDDVVKDTDYIN